MNADVRALLADNPGLGRASDLAPETLPVLEPFTGLQLDYIMSLLDAEEHAAIDQLAGRVARGSDRVLGPARPDAGPVPGGAW